MLATSRSPLRLSGEREYPVPPLKLPPLDPVPPVLGLLDNEAVQLFVQRAEQRRGPGPDLSPAGWAPVGAGAGGGSRPSMVARRVRWRGGRSRAPPISRPRRESSRDQEVFADLSVFAGGCTLDGIEAVVSSPGSLPPDLLDRLDALVGHSLVRTDSTPVGGPRSSMLETIREYAAERLDAAARGTAVRRRHAEHYLALAENAAAELTGRRQREGLARLRAEDDNLRSVLSWSAENDNEVRLRLSGALAHYWEMTGALDEGRRWLEMALTHADGASMELQLPGLRGGRNVGLRPGRPGRGIPAPPHCPSSRPRLWRQGRRSVRPEQLGGPGLGGG